MGHTLHAPRRGPIDCRRRAGAWWTGSAAASITLSLALGLVGCGSLDPVSTYQQITDPAQLFMSLALNQHAINLSTAAPYNTFQLSAVPRNALGQPMGGLPAPVFKLVQAEDSLKVTVTPDGLLTAKDATDSVAVMAEVLTGDNVRRVDFAVVQVTTNPTPAIPTSLSIDPDPVTDSAVWSMPPSTSSTSPLFLCFAHMIPVDNCFAVGLAGNITQQVKPHILDAANNPVTGLRVEYTTLDPDFVTVDRWRGYGAATRPGHARLVARTVAYGDSLADTLTVSTTWPIVQDIEFWKTGPLPADVRIAPNGIVFWYKTGGFTYSETGEDLLPPIDVTFDDPTNVAAFPAGCTIISLFFGSSGDCGPGNLTIPKMGLPGDNGCFAQNLCHSAFRQFPMPGIYPYRTSTGASGRIIVTADTTIS